MAEEDSIQLELMAQLEELNRISVTVCTCLVNFAVLDAQLCVEK